MRLGVLRRESEEGGVWGGGGIGVFFLQAEDGIRDLVRSRGLGDVYKRQAVRGESGRHGGAQPVAQGGERVRREDKLVFAEETAHGVRHRSSPVIFRGPQHGRAAPSQARVGA